MIPLIDISLILLIIFMVITPALVQSQIKVNLPGASSGAKGTDEGTIRVRIGADGKMDVEGKSVSESHLEKELNARLGKAASKTVLVEADRSVAIEKAVKVLDTAKKLGAGKIGIAVQEKQEK